MSTTLGDIILELDAEKAPVSTRNFLRYASEKYYNGTIFHRVMPNFMIQGGGFLPSIDKKEDGLHDPIVNEWRNGLKNVRGTIAMARTAAPDSATSQFYINVVDNPSLDQPRGGAAYAVFGKVVEGIETVDKIRNTETEENPKYPGGKVVPTQAVVINSVELQGEYDVSVLDAAVKDAEAKAAEARAAEEAAAEAARAEQEAANAKKRVENEAYLESHASKEGVKKTASGLLYRVIRPGEGDKPSASDTVTVNYKGTLIDGTQFDSSYDRGEPATFPLNRVIPGWTEGVQLIAPGGKIELVIPQSLGYGARGAGNVIPPYSTLVFEVELLSIAGE